ncbi:RidA family protein [Halioxenophilus sp. WMMB6]|uniref:RidA family protein n=1 Tax=Halioxenophilus sp. WMMB6 TaxID=3073815 RepID=UPI00295F10AA|nr:Rid family hydrolase [Halioxenophilus sp. WMMB6]
MFLQVCRVLLISLAASSAWVAQAADVALIHKGAVYPQGVPFSEVAVVNDTIYLAGTIGVKPGTLTLVEGGMEAEAKQTMDNVKAALESAGYAMSDLVKCTVMLADIAEWGAFNAIYKTYFSDPYPVRSALGANGLALGARVEVECIGAVPNP